MDEEVRRKSPLTRVFSRERIQAGLQAARARGRTRGWPKALTTDQQALAVKLYAEKQHTVAQIGRLLEFRNRRGTHSWRRARNRGRARWEQEASEAATLDVLGLSLAWDRPDSPQYSSTELAVRCARHVGPSRRKRHRRSRQEARSLDSLPLPLRPLERRRAA
jgi:hypothetical protein